MTSKNDVIAEFTKIKGVGKAKAEALYKNGFDSIDKLKKATLEELTKVDGVTEGIAKNIIDHFTISEVKEKKTKVEAKKTVEEKETKKPADVKEEKKKRETKPEKEVEPEKEEETKEYKPKKKPVLPEEIKQKLIVRKKIKKRTPRFLREEWFRYKRIPLNWRKPDGITSKMRKNLKYRPSMVRVGFRVPGEVRGLHPSGFEEIMVYNVDDLKNIDPKTQAARIGGSVGTRKRVEIEKKAEELDIRILNM